MLVGVTDHSSGRYKRPNLPYECPCLYLQQTAHCKTKGSDLGSHVIGPGGKDEIRTRTNFWGTNFVSCGVSWQGGHVEFDAFKAKRDFWKRCTYCRWEVREDAVAGFHEETIKPDTVIPWKK